MTNYPNLHHPLSSPGAERLQILDLPAQALRNEAMVTLASMPHISPDPRVLRFAQDPAYLRDLTAADTEARFADGYTSSRKNFLQLAHSARAELYCYTLDARGPHEESLCIDVAHLGNPSAKKAVLILSGVHGNEGRIGSALQQEMLWANPQFSDDCMLILVHALNPYGMLTDRRSNENNVDLNRNYCATHQGAPEKFASAREILMPRSILELEKSLAFFDQCPDEKIRELQFILAPGQYEFPEDPYYGGKKLEQSIEMLKAHIQTRLSSLESLLVVDIHTGMGKRGEDTIFYLGDNANLKQRIQGALGSQHEVRDPKVTIPFFHTMDGHVAGGLIKEFPELAVQALVQEVGTYPGRDLFAVLCVENFCRRNLAPEYIVENARAQNREFFCPSGLDWRLGVLQRGSEIITRSCEVMFS